MGKGDKKTRRGKIKNKTYGNLRPNPRNERKKKLKMIIFSGTATIPPSENR
ncbi:30S ribosomal protein THX [Blattabacterium cuenoti]|uniref:30S ribosomal protein THX n=1 Tax=Blattabacterium cuenoti TaxID=1653831 RepID=UPI00311F0D77